MLWILTIIGIFYMIHEVLKEKFDEKGSLIFWIGFIILLALLGVR